MPTKRFVIDVAGAPRSLFSVNDRGLETTLGLKSPFAVDRLGRHPLTMTSQPASNVTQQYFSIHASAESDEGITAINQHTLLANEQKLTRRHYTKSIKSGENFALIYCRRCGVLNTPYSLARGSRHHHIHLRSFDPDHFTLIYAVVVAAKENEFKPKETRRWVNIHQHVFSNVRIVVLWTFLNVPSIPEFYTVYAETDRNNRESWIGMSADQCVQAFWQHAFDAKFEMMHVLPTLLMFSLKQHLSSTFFKDGFADTLEYMNYRYCMGYRPYYSIRQTVIFADSQGP